MKGYVVESIFEHKGLKCVVVMQLSAHRCGYVGVQKDHALYGKDYSHHLEIRKEDIRDREVCGIFPLINAAFDEDERVMIEAYFQCHGGITYSNGGIGSKYPIESDLWWFGFDCNHAGDRKDYKTAKILFSDDLEELMYIERKEEFDRCFPIYGDQIRTLEFVKEECEKLADQLSDFMKMD